MYLQPYFILHIEQKNNGLRTGIELTCIYNILNKNKLYSPGSVKFDDCPLTSHINSTTSTVQENAIFDMITR